MEACTTVLISRPVRRWETDDKAAVWIATRYKTGKRGMKGRKRERETGREAEGGRHAPISLNSFNSTKQSAYY